MHRAATAKRIAGPIHPSNQNGIAIAEHTSLAGAHELTRSTVMDFVAAIEDEFDIIITMNQQAEIETYGQSIDARRALLAGGVEDPFNSVMERVLSPTVAVCNGRETISSGTYNYMGMTFDPDVISAGKQASDDFGSGTTGSRVSNGTYAGHRAVEDALKDFYGMEHAMVFSTGYQANSGIISTVAGKGDYIVLDIDSHASIWDGCKMG
ncbi:hypothetical protein OY671_008505, partial [Metschnikowia pulcherrima]